MKTFQVQTSVLGANGQLVWRNGLTFKARKLTNTHFSQQFSKHLNAYLDVSRIVGNVVVHSLYRDDRNFDCMRIIEIN